MTVVVMFIAIAGSAGAQPITPGTENQPATQLTAYRDCLGAGGDLIVLLTWSNMPVSGVSVEGYREDGVTGEIDVVIPYPPGISRFGSYEFRFPLPEGQWRLGVFPSAGASEQSREEGQPTPGGNVGVYSCSQI